MTDRASHLHKLILYAYIAGTAAGLLGIGGGMILNPIMLNMHFPAEVAAAISGFSVLFTSSSTTTQFIIQGAISVRDSIVFLTISGLGSMIGAIFITYLVKKYKRPSILIWIIFGLMALSAAVLPTMGIYKLVKLGLNFDFESPC